MKLLWGYICAKALKGIYPEFQVIRGFSKKISLTVDIIAEKSFLTPFLSDLFSTESTEARSAILPDISAATPEPYYQTLAV